MSCLHASIVPRLPWNRPCRRPLARMRLSVHPLAHISRNSYTVNSQLALSRLSKGASVETPLDLPLLPAWPETREFSTWLHHIDKLPGLEAHHMHPLTTTCRGGYNRWTGLGWTTGLAKIVPRLKLRYHWCALIRIIVRHVAKTPGLCLGRKLLVRSHCRLVVSLLGGGLQLTFAGIFQWSVVRKATNLQKPGS